MIVKNNIFVTVLISVYNGADYLHESLSSVLSQTYDNFEILVINDGSTDNSVNIINSFHDGRIRIINNGRNLGLTQSLNKGIQLAQGKYILRMDADDICLPNRFEEQIKFMEANQTISFSGTWFKILYSNRTTKPPVGDEEIKAGLFFYNPFGHPCMILKKEDFMKNELLYDEKFSYAQDYDLWVRASKKLKSANLNIALLQYREHQNQMSQVYEQKVIEEPNNIRINQLKEFISCTQDEINLHLKLLNGKLESNYEFILHATQWLEKLHYHNISTNIFSPQYFSRKLSEIWINLFIGAKKFNPQLLYIYVKSPLRAFSSLKTEQFSKFVIKCMIKHKI